ncbi:hypothetical protein H8A95_10015 [Bradyrhizobium sp. Pear76]|uniref:hypothetical protein n=1 Tax=Bradyrhizobium oropedii TaxID=1571201 RepID=UPI001E54BB61|nr:hypothetical protein [Bradyrhizobium oropedii]MCC8962634.1 hypothetical protein [Bradyrhizobium oropedii]
MDNVSSLGPSNPISIGSAPAFMDLLIACPNAARMIASSVPLTLELMNRSSLRRVTGLPVRRNAAAVDIGQARAAGALIDRSRWAGYSKYGQRRKIAAAPKAKRLEREVA